MEVAADGVTVNAVLPGYTRTERQIELADARSAETGEPVEAIFAAQGAEIAIGRVAEPEEIGNVVAFLCSPQASYLTGEFVSVDGGYVLGLA